MDLEFIALLVTLLLVCGFAYYGWTMLRSSAERVKTLEQRVQNIEDFIRQGGLIPAESQGHATEAGVVQQSMDQMPVEMGIDEIQSNDNGESNIVMSEEFPREPAAMTHEEEPAENIVGIVLGHLSGPPMEAAEDEEADADESVIEISRESLHNQKVPELKKLLADMGVSVPSGSRKNELIELILQHNGVADEVEATEEAPVEPVEEPAAELEAVSVEMLEGDAAEGDSVL